jgi:branched-chain amino acid transport system ATP-binding protein
MATDGILLDASEIVAGYGDLDVLHGVNLTVNAGEIVALIGSNGAGKTTLLRTIAGLLSARGGSIGLEGRDLTHLRTPGRVHAGIALVPEGRRLFAGLSVEQNLMLGAYLRTDHDEVRRNLEQVYELFPVLFQRRAQRAGSLSGGEQQMCTIGRGLMSAPRLLMIDELSLGLAPVAVDGLLGALDRLHQTGLTILLVEQDVQVALRLADRGYVLENGQISLSGKSETLLQDPALRTAYLGL